MKLTKSDILATPHIKAIGFDEVKKLTISGISTDSRTTKVGDLFIAIRGSQFDGHNFISKAIEAGAIAVIIEDRWAETNATMLVSINIPRLVVKDSIEALGQLAKNYRLKFKIPIIAVGGSNGKTTTKEMINAVLSTKLNTLCTEGNLNNHIGVPQTLFRLEKRHKIAIVEVGTNHIGEISYLCNILQPTHGLITNIGNEHLEFFGTLEGVAKAEGELFDWLAMNKGAAFINTDDCYLANSQKKMKKAISYGFNKRGVFVKGKIGSCNESGSYALSIKPRKKKAFKVKLNIPGEHNAKNALAAAAVGLTLKVKSISIQKALEKFQSINKRMQVRNINNIKILDDTYNANPDSMFAALKTLNAIKSDGKKIAVLADMLELGSRSEEFHRQVGNNINKFKIDILFTIGSLSQKFNENANVETKSHFDNKTSLIENLLQSITDGDIVLVKGSRGMRMEEVVNAIIERLSNKSGN